MDPINLVRHQSQSAIDTTRLSNDLSALVNMLPLEVLSNIFETVVVSEFNFFAVIEYEGRDNLKNQLNPPAQLVILALVCSRWHRVVINTPVLWSYVNLIVPGFHRQPFYSHALRHSSSAPMFLKIHQTMPSKPHQNHHLTTWLAAVAKRIYSLEICEGSATRELTNVVLSCWFQHGVPGTVKDLSLVCPRSDYRKYIQSSRSAPQPWRVNLSPAQLDAFLQPIFLLSLDGIFARWDSQAYQGLTNLQLREGSIKEEDLMNILTHNPQLCSFTFDLDIKAKRLRRSPPTPVRLPSLEVLNLDAMDNTCLWSRLRLLAPGLAPLRMVLAISDVEHLTDFAGTLEAQAFFQRSNVTTCYLSAYSKLPKEAWFHNILYRLPDLRRLCLRSLSYSGGDSLTQSGEIRVCSQLDELMIIDCKLCLDDFKDILRVHHIQTLRLWNCTAYRRGDEQVDVETESLEEELSGLVADTKCYEQDDYRIGSDPHMRWRYVDQM
ncbi:hypothetical protein FRC12_013379 [Ceratobasidium sp. 428]|nr:hypothetical protein FRC12_013379 [Ceratobasidium sp. 428]